MGSHSVVLWVLQRNVKDFISSVCIYVYCYNMLCTKGKLRGSGCSGGLWHGDYVGYSQTPWIWVSISCQFSLSPASPSTINTYNVLSHLGVIGNLNFNACERYPLKSIGSHHYNNIMFDYNTVYIFTPNHIITFGFATLPWQFPWLFLKYPGRQVQV